MQARRRFGLPVIVVALAGVMVGGALAGGSATRANPPFKLVQLTKAECPSPKKLFGKACVDDSGMIIDSAWSLFPTSATWEPDGWKATYKWTIPQTVTAAGSPITLDLTGESKQPGRICPAMGARGVPLKKAGETTDIGICADQATGAASISKTLVVVSPSSGPMYLLIGLQDGPHYVYKYVESAPPVKVPSSLTIRQIQSALKYLGLYNGPVDGRPSVSVTAAIKDFQRQVGLKVDGKCGPQCRQALAQARALDDPAVGDDEPPVTKKTVAVLQSDLQSLGFYAGPLDGRNGPRLAAAVKEFQRSAGIKVDGTCEAACQFALVRALNKD